MKDQNLKNRAKDVIAKVEGLPLEIYGIVRDYMIENGVWDDEDADLDVTPTEKYEEVSFYLSDQMAVATEVRYNEMTGDIEIVVEDDRERIDFYNLSTFEQIQLMKELI